MRKITIAKKNDKKAYETYSHTFSLLDEEPEEKKPERKKKVEEKKFTKKRRRTKEISEDEDSREGEDVMTSFSFLNSF